MPRKLGSSDHQKSVVKPYSNRILHLLTLIKKNFNLYQYVLIKSSISSTNFLRNYLLYVSPTVVNYKDSKLRISQIYKNKKFSLTAVSVQQVSTVEVNTRRSKISFSKIFIC